MLKKIAASVLVISAISHVVQAEVNFKNLKGSGDFFHFQEKYQHLAPEVAFSLVRSGKLNNDFMYGDEASPITHLIQKSFHSSSENAAFFQVSPLAVNSAKFLGPATLGQVVAEIGKHEPNSPPDPELLKAIILKSPEFQDKVKEAAEETKAAEQRLRDYQRESPRMAEIANLEDEIKQKESLLIQEKAAKKKEGMKSSEIQNCQGAQKKSAIEKLDEQLSEMFKPRKDEIETLKAQLKEKKEKRGVDPELQRLESAVSKVKYKEENLDTFIQAVIKAFQSETHADNPYPRHYTEQVLMGLAWLNAESDKTKLKAKHAGSENEKLELLALYRRLEGMMTEEGRRNLHDDANQNRWLNDRYKAEDYGLLSGRALQMKPEERARHFLEHPEELAFLAHGRPLFDSSALPTIGFKQIPYSHPETKVTTTFPDCMEMATLNSLLNALAGGPGNTFDVAALDENIKKRGYEMHPGLKEFLVKYPDASRINEPQAHQDWAKLVSNLPGIKYNRPEGAANKYCEMFPTVTNALNLYEHLLFSRPAQGRSLEFKLSALSRSEKLARVCEVLSRKDRKIEWQLKGSSSNKDLDDAGKDTNLVLEFAINGKPKYDWTINAGHSQVDPKASESGDWRKDVGPEMVKALKGKFTSPNVRALAWFLGSSDASKILENLKSERKNNFHRDILLSTPMETVDQKLIVIGELSEVGHKKEIEKLHQKIPSEDRVAQERFHATLADHHFPFQEREKSLATGSEFVQVEESRLGKGKFWRDSRGMVWGGTLKEKSGADRRLNWEDAKKECLKLNSESARKEVESALNQLESDEGIKNLRLAYSRDRNQKNREALLQKYNQHKKEHPPRGCFLPPVEEQMMLGVDLGYNENKKENRYIPQLLSDLYGEDSQGNSRWFWSSSVSPVDAGNAFVLNGSVGEVFYVNRFSAKSVWCSCVGAAW